MANNNPAHIVLTNVRLSYAHLDKPYSNNQVYYLDVIENTWNILGSG